MIAGCNDPLIYTSLSPAELRIYEELVTEIRNGKELSEDDALWRLDYVKKPVGIEQFFMDDYYLGETHRPSSENPGMWPEWKKTLVEDFDFNSKIHNLVITGSLGIGKCHRAGDRIMLADGSTKLVENIKVGDRLMGDDSKPRTVKSLATGEDDLFEVYPVKGGDAFYVNKAHILCLKSANDPTVVEMSVEDFLKLPRVEQRRYRLYQVPLEFNPRPTSKNPYKYGFEHKHGPIDNAYLLNHSTCRMPVLAGILDGHPCRAKGSTYACVVESSAADSVIWLARSLGFSVYAEKHLNRTVLKLTGVRDVPTKKSRKKVSSKRPRASILQSLLAVNPIGRGRYYGFTLDGNGRYLMADFTVTHNTSMMTTLLLYRLYIATCLRNPQHFFDIAQGSDIAYVILSVTKEAVKDTAFGYAMNYMAQSPYFRQECGFNPNVQYSNYRIPILNRLPSGKPSGLRILAGSKSQHALGRNVIGVGMDEGNFRLESNPDLSAYHLYDTLRTRIANRFQKIAGFLPALSIIASSSADESSFTEKVIKEITEANNPRAEKVYRHAIYRIKRHALKLIGWWFKVAYGLKNMEPFILEGLYNEDGTPIPVGETRLKGSGEPIVCKQHEEPPRGALTELVPGDHWEAYRRNCRAQLQNLSGVSTGGSHRLFPNIVDIEWCIEQSEREGVVNPAIPGMDMLPMSSEDNKNIWDYLDHKKFLTRVASRVQPIRHPFNKRYAHLDLATQTMAGLSICHLVGNQLVTGLVKNGEPFEEYRLIVEYDFILTIVAGHQKPINLEKINTFFYWLRDMCGFQFGLITADQFQSEASLQALEAKGFETGKLSVDRDKKVYNAWRAGFEERRLRLYRSHQMIREAEALLELDKKYDHPVDGCFTGDTRVRLLNGTAPTFKELFDSKSENFWVYASDGNGKVVPAKATRVRLTKTVTKLTRVTLDNGKQVKCTPDHLFMRRDGTYCAASLLEPGTSLMPLYTKDYIVKYQTGKGIYEQVYSEGKWIMTHKLVSVHLGFAAKRGETVIHHYDINPKNNSPENLECLTIEEHNRRHILINEASRRPDVVKRRVETFKQRYSHNEEFLRKKAEIGRRVQANLTPEQKIKAHLALTSSEACERNRTTNQNRVKDLVYRQSLVDRMTAYAKSDKGRKTSSLRATQTNLEHRAHWSEERLLKHKNSINRARQIRHDFDDKVAFEKIGDKRPYLLGVCHAIKLTGGGGSYTWRRRLKDDNFSQNVERLRGLSVAEMCQKTGLSESSLKQFIRKLNRYDLIRYANHKVVSVETLIETADVYDVEVPYYSNFAIECGVFVHNSKDTTDSASGAYFNAISSDEKMTISSVNSPAAATGRDGMVSRAQPVPIEIVLPAASHDRSKIFVG